MRASPALVALFVIVCTLIISPAATADWIGDYYPLILNSTWTFQNYDPPFDQYTESVFEQFVYDGHPAVRRGEDYSEHTIASSDGQIVTVYAEVHGGVLFDYTEDVVLGEFEDGTMFEICPGGECDTLLIRRWSALDPALRAIYEIDPAFDDLVAISSYDRDYDSNLHNAILASNLPGGIIPPTGGVTNIDWYQRDVGLAATHDIDAETGDFGWYYYLIDYSVVGVDDAPGTPDAVVLEQNFPNPFNPRTTIRYILADAAPVTLTIHDAAGRLVRTLAGGTPRPAGVHTATWRGLDDLGRPQASGTYYCRVRAAGREQTMKMMLVR